MRETTLRVFMLTALTGCILAADSSLADEGIQGRDPGSLRSIFALMEVYTYQLFHPSSALPDHVWMDAGAGRVVFLHFNKPVTDPTATVIFAGDGIKGRFCTEDQPDRGKTGFVHFHRLSTPEKEIGHGGMVGEEGYWLKHVAVAEFDLMGAHYTPGVAMNFMPTTPPRCSS